VDRWLEVLATTPQTKESGGREGDPLATRTIVSILRRSIKEAQRRDLVLKNVVGLVTPPKGGAGRPSRALSIEQADALKEAARRHRWGPYFIVSVTQGLRTEEARALTWDRVHLEAEGDLPPRIEVWRSVRDHGDTKTKRSRRTIALCAEALEALRTQRKLQAAARLKSRQPWQDSGLVFTTRGGAALDSAAVRRAMNDIVKAAGIPGHWSPRELRHTFASILSDNGLPLEEIADLMGHAGPHVTGAVYRKQIKPVIRKVGPGASGASAASDPQPSVTPLKAIRRTSKMASGPGKGRLR
jgi:integrase